MLLVAVCLAWHMSSVAAFAPSALRLQSSRTSSLCARPTVLRLRPGHILRGSALRLADCDEPEGGEEAPEPFLYQGPLGNRDEMETGFEIQELGLTLMVGKSTVAPGRGLFVALADEAGVDRVELPEGTLFAGYSKVGAWAVSAQGDKAVAYAFEDPDTACVCEKELKPLIEAVGSHSCRTLCFSMRYPFARALTSRVSVAPHRSINSHLRRSRPARTPHVFDHHGSKYSARFALLATHSPPPPFLP